MITVLNHYKTDVNALMLDNNNKVLNIMQSKGSPLGNLNYNNKTMPLHENLNHYLAWLREEYNKQGEVFTELMKIVNWEKGGKNTYLVCCCKPKDCHGDIIKNAAEAIVKQHMDQEDKRPRIIVAGGRNFNDFNLMTQSLDNILTQAKVDKIVVVSGKAKGADTLGERYAKLRGHAVAPFPADWNNISIPGAVVKTNSYGKYNSRAGHMRNEKMARYTAASPVRGVLVAFWNGNAGGTSSMIKIARSYGLRVFVIKCNYNSPYKRR